MGTKPEIELEEDNELKVNSDESFEEIEEQTEAASTLKPASRKADVLSAIVSHIAGMSKEDLTAFYKKSVANIGKEGDVIPDGAAAKNLASVTPKNKPVINIKEDLADLFGGDETLTEEFKENASALFEAVVNTRVELEVARLEEEYEEKLDEAIEEINQDVVSKVDEYLSYVVEEWMKENEVAIESSLKSEITESFIEGLRNLFAENYIDAPEEKLDIVEALSERVEELESLLNEEINEKIELKKVLDESLKNSIIDEISEGLTLSESEKFKTLAENVSYVDDEDYERKLNYIKESVFNKKTTTTSSNLIVEEAEEEDQSERVVSNSPVSRYAQAISRGVR